VFERARWVVAAAALLWSSAAPAQIFQSQGPAPRVGPATAVQTGFGGPDGTAAGAIQAVIADPALGANTLFAGSVNGGVFVTNDFGKTWKALTDKQASLSIASLGLDPMDPTSKTIVAGVGITSNGDWNNNMPFQGRGGRQTGLLYTTNAGASWSPLGGTTLADQSVIGVAARGSTILAATFEEQDVTRTQASSGAYGLYRSVNGGASFSRVGALPGPVTSLVADPTNAARFYAAVTSASDPEPDRDLREQRHGRELEAGILDQHANIRRRRQHHCNRHRPPAGAQARGGARRLGCHCLRRRHSQRKLCQPTNKRALSIGKFGRFVVEACHAPSQRGQQTRRRQSDARHRSDQY
jgi:hypothetical protein